MRKARIMVNAVEAGVFEELENGKYKFTYHPQYQGAPISLTLPIKKNIHEFNKFPAFFECLLPEGDMLKALLFKCKLDANDYFGQLLQVGHDVVGAVTIEALE